MWGRCGAPVCPVERLHRLGAPQHISKRKSTTLCRARVEVRQLQGLEKKEMKKKEKEKKEKDKFDRPRALLWGCLRAAGAVVRWDIVVDGVGPGSGGGSLRTRIRHPTVLWAGLTHLTARY